jgi:hypothetical protein
VTARVPRIMVIGGLRLVALPRPVTAVRLVDPPDCSPYGTGEFTPLSRPPRTPPPQPTDDRCEEDAPDCRTHAYARNCPG